MTHSLPPVPATLDDPLYVAMIEAVGETLAMRACEAVWNVLLDRGRIVTRSDKYGVTETLEYPLGDYR